MNDEEVQGYCFLSVTAMFSDVLDDCVLVPAGVELLFVGDVIRADVDPRENALRNVRGIGLSN